jgi:hypothetical protein
VNMIIVQPVTRSWMEERIEMLEAEVVRLRGQNELLIMRVREHRGDGSAGEQWQSR